MRRPLPLLAATLTLALPACDFGVVCTLEARPGITAVVRDSLTGAGLAGATLGLARASGFVDTLRGIDSVMAGVHERPGVYRVEFSSAGYQDWVREGVRVDAGECHVETVRLRVLLAPE